MHGIYWKGVLVTHGVLSFHNVLRVVMQLIYPSNHVHYITRLHAVL